MGAFVVNVGVQACWFVGDFGNAGKGVEEAEWGERGRVGNVGVPCAVVVHGGAKDERDGAQKRVSAQGDLIQASLGGIGNETVLA